MNDSGSIDEEIDIRTIQQRFYSDRKFHELCVALMQGIERKTVTLEDVDQAILLLRHAGGLDRPRITLM